MHLPAQEPVTKFPSRNLLIRNLVTSPATHRRTTAVRVAGNPSNFLHLFAFPNNLTLALRLQCQRCCCSELWSAFLAE
jgi:hypothetical protein